MQSSLLLSLAAHHIEVPHNYIFIPICISSTSHPVWLDALNFIVPAFFTHFVCLFSLKALQLTAGYRCVFCIFLFSVMLNLVDEPFDIWQGQLTLQAAFYQCANRWARDQCDQSETHLGGYSIIVRSSFLIVARKQDERGASSLGREWERKGERDRVRVIERWWKYWRESLDNCISCDASFLLSYAPDQPNRANCMKYCSVTWFRWFGILNRRWLTLRVLSSSKDGRVIFQGSGWPSRSSDGKMYSNPFLYFQPDTFYLFNFFFVCKRKIGRCALRILVSDCMIRSTDLSNGETRPLPQCVFDRRRNGIRWSDRMLPDVHRRLDCDSQQLQRAVRNEPVAQWMMRNNRLDFREWHTSRLRDARHTYNVHSIVIIIMMHNAPSHTSSIHHHHHKQSVASSMLAAHREDS